MFPLRQIRETITRSSSSPEGVPPGWAPPEVRAPRGSDSRHSQADPRKTHDLYLRVETVGPSSRDVDAMFELSKVRSACRGFSLYSVQDELDVLEQGRYLAYDPALVFSRVPGATPTAWLYRNGLLPEVRNGIGR